MSTAKKKHRVDLRFLFKAFLVWRIFILVFLILAISSVPLQKSFLGGGLTNYLKNPYLWSGLNFDGEHYLSIAYFGYRSLQYFYFPVFPLLTRSIASLFGQSPELCAFVGLLINHLAFFLALFGLWKLIMLDFNKKIARDTMLLLLVFPTSFYFVSFYTESLFLLFTVWSFYFMRKRKWLKAGLLGALSTATRIVGLALIPAYLVEIFAPSRGKKIWNTKNFKKKLISVLIIPIGLLVYMNYLKGATGDPLEFLHSVDIFGAQRSSSFVFLPQVFYRYLFKILPNINYDYFPVVFTTWLEFLTAIIFALLGAWGLAAGLKKTKNIKLPLSYAIYLVLGYLIPTLSGSFSSLPRYVLVLFPAFVLGSVLSLKSSAAFRYTIYVLLFICLQIASSLFLRGFWVS